MPFAAASQTNNWIGTTPPYANPANWQNAAVPLASETAVFSTLGTSRTLAIGTGTSVGAWQFAAGAPGYTFTISTTYQFLGSGILDSSSTAPIVQVAGAGTLLFSNSSSAGDASLRNTAGTARITFQDSSTAGTGSINNTVAGAAVSFQDSASAGSSTITNANGNTVAFTGSASAGNATINSTTSTISFAGSTTAGSAAITNNSGTVTFAGSASAGNATITNNGAPSKTAFTGTSTGGQARLITNAAGVVDISGLTSSGMTAGSIEGTAGTFRLGSKQLTVGGNNLSTTFGGSIVDGGDSGGTGASLVKTGTGTLTLVGNSTYTGGTTISGGTLQVGSGGTTGSLAAGNIVNNGTLVINRSNQTIINNVISGTGTLQQNGTNLLVLTGANTYTGPTIVSRGTLQIGTGGVVGAISGDVTNNATFQIIRANTTGLTSITTNANATSLFFNNSSAGTATLTTNSGGFLGFRENASGGQAQFVTNAGGTVDISGISTSGMSAGSIAGAGNYNLGSKQLTVGGNNLSSTMSGVIADGGLLGGTGASLVKTGTGTLTLSGNNTFTGGTTIDQGLLIVNGSLASGVTLSGGALGGNGSIGTLTANNATIAPGNSIGTLNINGNFVQNGGTYLVEVNAAGQSDRINTTGSATINGSAVQVVAEQGSYARNTTYTILTAAGGLSGTYTGGVTSNFAFLTPTLSYDANNVYLSLFQSQSAFAAGAQTANQYAVGTVLDLVNASATGDLNTVLSALSVLSNTQGPAALNAISGQPYADFGTMNVQGAALFMNLVGQQTAAARGAGGGGGQRQALAQACEIESCDAASPWGTWASALGGLGTVAGNGNASTFTYNLGGGAAGIDYRLDPRLLVGVGAGYAAGNQWVDSFMGRGWSDTVSATVYGSFAQDGFYADALAGYAYSGNQMQRQIVISGLQPRTANGSTGVNQLFGQVESGYRLAVFAPAQASVTPFARLQGSTATQNGFSEWGSASSLALTVAQQTTNSLRSTFGADLAGAVGLGDTRTLDLGLRLGWLHEYADTGRPITAAFAGAPANAFTVYGATPQRDSAVIGFSASTLVADATQVYLRYDGEVSSGSSNHALNVGVRFTW